MGEVERIPGFSDLKVPCTRDTKALRVDCSLPVDELTQELPNFLQSMPKVRLLQLSKDMTGEWDQSIDPFGSFTPALGYLEWISFSLPLAPRLSIAVGLVFTWTTLLDFLEENHSLGV